MMPEYNELLQQIFQQYGLAGLLISILVMGPIFTLIRTKNMHLQTEAKAQELLSEFVRQEHQRADRLEERLDEALNKLDQAEAEVVQLRLKVHENQEMLEEMENLRQQGQELTQRVAELEGVIEIERANNRNLQSEVSSQKAQLIQRDQQIHDLGQQVRNDNC